jgi:hypothetical protein
VINASGVKMVDNHNKVRKEMNDLLLCEEFPVSFIKKLFEKTLRVYFYEKA